MSDGRIGTIGSLLLSGKHARSELANCPVYQYPRPALTADMVVFDLIGDFESCKVLLIERGKEPFKGQLALPGGYVNIDETAKAAAIRELEEETGLIVPDSAVSTVGFFDDPNRNPAGRVINMAYWCLNPEYCSLNKHGIVAGDDAVAIGWYDIAQILDSKVELAFDHKEIVDIAYNLLWKRMKVRETL